MEPPEFANYLVDLLFGHRQIHAQERNTCSKTVAGFWCHPRAALQHSLDFGFLKSQNDLAALHQDRPLDEIGVRGHQFQGFGA